MMTVVAADGYAYASLANGETVAPTPEPSASSAWDLAFFATTVTVNGGQAGPAGIAAHCICQNQGASNPDVLAMTSASELADFEAVGAADIPSASSAWSTDVLTPAIDGWVTGAGAEASLVDGKFWKLRLDDGESFSKLRIASIEDMTATHAGTATIEYAVQETETSAFGPLRTITIDLAAGPVSVDLNANAIVSAASWDVRVEGYTIRVNSGVSGAGQAGAASPEEGEDFATLGSAVIAEQAYLADRYAGVFGEHPWYRYNLTGAHGVHPTFDVYLVRRGSSVFKLQLLNYYGPAGQARHITFRYEQIAP